MATGGLTSDPDPMRAGADGPWWGSPELGWPADPFPAYAEARAAAPVRETVLRNGRRVWLVTGYAEARTVLADPRFSTDGRRFFRRYWGAPAAGAGDTELEMSLAEHMLSTDPPDHTRLRRLVSQAFTLRRVEALRPRVTEIATALADGLAGRVEADLIAEFAFPLPIQVICELLGVPVADEARFRGWFRAMIAVGPIEEMRPRAQRAAADVAAYLSELMAEKRARPTDDLVSALVAARDGDQVLTEAELFSTVFLLLLAGHETTVNLIGNGVVALLDHPDQLDLLRQRPDLVDAAVDELLRFDGPVHHPTFRFAMEPVTLGGTTVPAGAIMLVALGAANRDPARFPEPDHLDVTRRDRQHLGFGHGPHFCLGAPLARMEGRIALGLLVERFAGLRLGVARDVLAWREGVFLRGLESLPVLL